MKSIHIFIKTLFLTVIFTGCSEEFLTKNNPQAVATQDALLTLEDFEAAIIGVYDQFQNSDYYGRYFVLVPDVMSDDVKQNASANRAKEWAEYNGNATDFIPEEVWTEIYEAIDRSNRIINATTTFPASVQDKADHIKGEALALRAMAHFDLVRIYGQHYTYTAGGSHPGIPIITTFDPTNKPSRNTVGEVYNAVVADLTAALPLLTIDPGSSGYISANAAKALLSRVYLYMEDWANAEKYASEVINSGDYSLVKADSYADAFTAGEMSESIFEIIMNPVDNNGSDALGGMYNKSGYGDYLPSLDLYNRIPDTDARKELFVADTGLGALYGSLRVGKYPSNQGVNNTYVLRYSEVLLNRAEANFHLNKETLAQDDINTLRQARNPAAADVTATGQTLLDEILLERRIELCYEGHRLWDLMRYKMGVDRTRESDCTSTVCTIAYPNNRFILPIPIPEMDVNPNISQNEGY